MRLPCRHKGTRKGLEVVEGEDTLYLVGCWLQQVEVGHASWKGLCGWRPETSYCRRSRVQVVRAIVMAFVKAMAEGIEKGKVCLRVTEEKASGLIECRWRMSKMAPQFLT